VGSKGRRIIWVAIKVTGAVSASVRVAAQGDTATQEN
jgi:hypothetical protein